MGSEPNPQEAVATHRLEPGYRPFLQARPWIWIVIAFQFAMGFSLMLQCREVFLSSGRYAVIGAISLGVASSLLFVFGALGIRLNFALQRLAGATTAEAFEVALSSKLRFWKSLGVLGLLGAVFAIGALIFITYDQLAT